VSNSEATLIYLQADVAFFRVPLRLKENDISLTIQSMYGQIIFESPIQESDSVVPRSFDVSHYHYTPKNKESTFKFEVTLQPTVNITTESPISMELPGFSNVMSKDHIHITGKDGQRFELPMGFDVPGIEAAGKWEEDLQVLTLWPLSGTQFTQFEDITFEIEESQGFILPRKSLENADNLRIWSGYEGHYNILPEKVKISPLVGDGPYEDQRYCLIQYEKGTRTSRPTCQTPCFPPIRDPCSPRELDRCDCYDIEEEPVEMVIDGFQLQKADTMGAIPEMYSCDEDFESHMEPGFVIRNENSDVSKDNFQKTFPNVTSSVTGFFNLCLRHKGDVFSVGLAVVRPSCTPATLVMVEGICVEHCPPSKIPVAGECVNDPVARLPLDQQAIMLSVKMDQRSADEDEIFKKHWDDPERQQFVYQFSSSVAKSLATPMDRFRISSVSNGSVIVNVVMTPQDEDTIGLAQEDVTSRSPSGLLSLLRALQSDPMSSIYGTGEAASGSKFFSSIDRTYQPSSIKVYKCQNDNEYRTICPYKRITMPLGAQVAFFWGCTAAGMLFLSVGCFCCWRCDKDNADEKVESILKQDVLALNPSMKAEFARSWMENRVPLPPSKIAKNEDSKDRAADRLAVKDGNDY